MCKKLLLPCRIFKGFVIEPRRVDYKIHCSVLFLELIHLVFCSETPEEKKTRNSSPFIKQTHSGTLIRQTKRTKYQTSAFKQPTQLINQPIVIMGAHASKQRHLLSDPKVTG